MFVSPFGSCDFYVFYCLGVDRVLLGSGEPFPAAACSDSVAVMKAAMLELSVIVDNKSVTSSQLIKET